MEEENKSWANRAATMRRDYFKALDDLREKNKTIIESNRQAMQSMVAAQERVVSAYRNAANAALRIVQESQNRRTALEAQADDQRFKERNKQLNLEHGAGSAGHPAPKLGLGEAGQRDAVQGAERGRRAPRAGDPAAGQGVSRRGDRAGQADAKHLAPIPGGAERPVEPGGADQGREAVGVVASRPRKSWRTRPPRSRSGSTR